MLDVYLITSVLLAISFVVLGLVVYARNNEVAANRAFIVFSVLVALWLISNFLGGNQEIPHVIAVAANRLLFFFGLLALGTMLVFSFTLTKKRPDYRLRTVLVLTVFVSLLCLTPFVVRDVVAQNRTYEINFGFLAWLYFGLAFANSIYAAAVLVGSRSRLPTSRRVRINLILGSLSLSVLIILITNLIAPLFFGYYGLVAVGVFSTSIVIWGMAYAIVRHGLFDVRFLVVRSLGYIFSIGVLVLLQAILIFFLLTYVFGLELSIYAQLSISIIIALATFVSQPIKRLFDRISNGLFFRDAYDARVLLDRLNQIFINSVRLDELLKNTTKVIAETLRATRLHIGLNEQHKHPAAVSGNQTISTADLNHIRNYMVANGTEVLIVDALDEDQEGLRALCADHDISLFARVTHSVHNSADDLAYLIFSQKQSGNNYTRQDQQVIRTITKELYVGIQNALHFREIQEFNETLQQRVEEATRQMRRTNEKLKALDETKDDFISMASHQLRTPLTSIKGYLSMVIEGDAGKITDLQRKMLEQAFISSQRMAYLISDLLNVSRLKNGKFLIDPSPVNLASMVQQEVAQLTESAKSRNVSLKYSLPDSFPELSLDETKTRQVIMNFVDNAIYYTPSGGTIEIIVEEREKTVKVTVNDNGIGVPKALQHHLFTKFYRAPNAKHARPDGTGLGLFMAKKVIIAQGGAIIFRSEEGKGSTFGFSFPKNT